MVPISMYLGSYDLETISTKNITCKFVQQTYIPKRLSLTDKGNFS